MAIQLTLTEEQWDTLTNALEYAQQELDNAQPEEDDQDYGLSEKIGYLFLYFENQGLI